MHLWLDASGPVSRGDPVRVYVRTAADGFLIVVQRTTDGRIRVLFPANPSDDPFVRSGTYEIRSAGDGVTGAGGGWKAGRGGGGGGAAFVVAEPDGQGLVLAALSPSPFHFHEFVRVADWNPDALRPSWEGADAVGGVTDIVQRMLGDGYFNYDIASYTVAPRTYAQAPAPPQAPQDEGMPASCFGCTFIGSQVVIIESPLLGFDVPRFPCDHRSPCADPVPASAMALPSRYRVTASGGLQRRDDGVVPARLPEARPTIGPRRRQAVARDLPAAPAALPVQAIPLGPGRRLAASGGEAGGMSEARGGAVVGVWAPTTASRPATSGREVRLTMSPIPVREEPPPPPPSTAATALPVNLNVMRRVLVPAAGELVVAPPAVRSDVAVTSMSRSFLLPEAVAQASARGGGGGAGGRARQLMSEERLEQRRHTRSRSRWQCGAAQRLAAPSCRLARGGIKNALALVAALFGLLPCGAGVAAQEVLHPAGSIRGTVVAVETGAPLPFSVVALLPAFSRRFTDQTGAFTVTGLAAGSYRLLARQIGYNPLDTVFAVRADSVTILRIALSHVAVQLPPVTITGRTTCVSPGGAIAPELAAVFDQLLENARRFELLTDSFPHRYRIERVFTTVDRQGRNEVSQVDTFERESSFRWPYRPGRIVGPATGPLNNDRLVRLPSLPDFADSTFVQAHCFRLVGRDTLAGSTFIRLDFAPVATLRATDVEGAAYMDPATFQIRYATVRLTRPEREIPGVAAMVATIHFSEIAPGILLHDHVRAVETFGSSHTPTERIEEQRLLGVHFRHPLIHPQ